MAKETTNEGRKELQLPAALRSTSASDSDDATKSLRFVAEFLLEGTEEVRHLLRCSARESPLHEDMARPLHFAAHVAVPCHSIPSNSKELGYL